ncbi:hypothetical protein Tco_0652164 [Tanacetum coccineum]|uniref:Uncharacterized protein n=1 Tax=Tanacetum coccineum TaxID=301880 RepID=A0ABQ4WX66_9ASTR
MHKGFEKGYLLREGATNTLPSSSQRKQLSHEYKEMLRRKLNEIKVYNASKGRAAVKEKGEGSVNTTKEKRARCYICIKRGHVFWMCLNNKNPTTLEAPTIDNQSKEATMLRNEERLKYPKNVHVKTDYMIEVAQGFGVTYGHNKCQISYMFEEDKEGCDGETDYATSKEGNSCDVETKSRIAKHNKYLEEYIDSIDSKDACPVIKGLDNSNGTKI